MAKHNVKGRSKTDGKFVQCFRWQLECEAYRSLTVYSRCLLTEIKLRYTGENNGYVSMSVKEAQKRTPCSQNTARKAFDELIEKGFIKPNVRGSFSWKAKHATTWILTEYKHDGKLSTKDFMKWRKPPQNEGAKIKTRCHHVIGTVSRDDTQEAPRCHEMTPTVSPDDTQEAKIDPSTVSPRDTLIVCHVPPSGNAPIRTRRPEGANGADLLPEQPNPSPDHAQNKLSQIFGDHGHLITDYLSPETLQDLTAKRKAGPLIASDISAARREAEAKMTGSHNNQVALRRVNDYGNT